MKTFTFSVFTVATTLALPGAQVTVPETTPILNNNITYDRGELSVSYSDTFGFAEMFVGDNSGRAVKIADSAALRGRVFRNLAPSEYFVQVGDDVQVSNGVYYVRQPNYTTNAWIRIHPLQGSKITDILYNKESVKLVDFGTSPNIAQSDVWKLLKYNGYYEFSAATQDWTKVAGRFECRLYDITPIAVSEDTANWENNLTLTEFILRDKLGRYNLNDLREWARDYHRGNLGEDWAKFPPKTNRIYLDRQRLFMMQVNDNKLDFLAARKSAMRIDVLGDGGTTPDVLGIYNKGVTPVVSNNTVTLRYTFHLAAGKTLNFDSVNIMYSPSIGDDADWQIVEYAMGEEMVGKDGENYYEFTVAANFDVSNGTNAGFYKATYGGVTSHTIMVAFSGDVKVLGGLYLKGDDNILYRLKVTGGNITAEAQL